MKYLSLFSGIGGFELGIKQAYEDYNRPNIRNRNKNIQKDMPNTSEQQDRATCIGYSEIDKYAIQIYEKHFNHKNSGDITKIKWEEVPDVDLFTCGFPCQSFSIAGKRKGFEDTRGTLFFDIAKGLKVKQPNFVLLENVKGLISHDKGKTLEVILETLQELGYYVNIEVYNSKDFFVPQNRERIIFICRHIKTLTNIGQSESLNLSSPIISEYLFQILLNNLAEVQKLQGVKSKDWVIAWLLWKEINQNLTHTSQSENIKGGTTILSEESKYLSTEELWQSIGILLNKELGEGSSELNKSTILTEIKQTIGQRTYTFLKMQRSILFAIGLLRNSSKDSWRKILSNLILVKEHTKKYARINDKKEEVIITETGNAYLIPNLQDFEKYFIVGHLRGTSRPEVFPFGESNERDINPQKETQRKGKRVRGNIASTLAQRDYKGGNNLIQRQPLRFLDRNQKNVDGKHSFTVDTSNAGGVRVDNKIRRLTPTECERLQGFPEIEKYGIIQVCIENQKKNVNVDNQNHKSQKLAGNVGKKDSQENAQYVIRFLNTKNQQIDKLVQNNVLINCEENGVEILSQGKLLLNAKNAEKKNWSHQHIKIDDFVQMLVGINIMLEKITKRGEVDCLQREQFLTPQRNGKKLENLFGKEIMQPVGDVEKDLITLKELLKFITLNHLDIESLEQKLITLSSFVIRAIIGYIPSEIKNQDTFTIKIKTKVGWTEGVSDTQRYKVLGNAVTVNVVREIIKKFL